MKKRSWLDSPLLLNNQKPVASIATKTPPLSARIAVGMRLKRSDGRVVTLTKRVPENGVPGWDYVVDDGSDGWLADEHLDDFEGHYTILGSLIGVCPPDTKLEVINLDRRHNAHCPRCYGPAYQGLGALRCEREGGCLADVEPRDGVDVWATDYPSTDCHLSPERGWACTTGSRRVYATRELAVAAWREAAIAKTKREAGL